MDDKDLKEVFEALERVELARARVFPPGGMAGDDALRDFKKWRGNLTPEGCLRVGKERRAG